MEHRPPPLIPLEDLASSARALVAAQVKGIPVGYGSHQNPSGSAIEVPSTVLIDLVKGRYGDLVKNRIDIQGCLFDGDIDLSFFEWHGELRLKYCHIAGEVNFSHSRIKGAIILDHCFIHSVDVSYANIEGRLSLNEATCASGFYGLGLSLTGGLSMRSVKVTAPRDKPNRCAVELYRASVGDIFLSKSTLVGGLYGNALHVPSNIRLQEAVIISRESLGWETGPDSDDGAVSLVGATVGGALYLSWKDAERPSWRVIGPVILSRVTCTTLRVRLEHLLTADLYLDHLRYDRLLGITQEDWFYLLLQTPSVKSQPFQHLAQYCAELGKAELQRKSLVAAQERLTGMLPRRSVDRMRRRCWGILVNYGYAPARALFWLALCVVLSAVVLRIGGDFLVKSPSALPPTRGVQSLTDAVTIALDSLLPFANLGAAQQWSADPVSGVHEVWMMLFIVLKFSSWGLAALGLASVTGLTRKT